MEHIGKRIKRLRMKHGDTLKELGKRINFNFSNLSKIERGERKPSIELLEQLSEVYDVKLSYFFGEEGEVTEELNNIGVEWAAFAEEMKEKEITPQEIRAILQIMNKISKENH